MWRLLRPDAEEVLRDEKAAGALGRYFAVMGDRLPSRANVAKRVGVDIGMGEGTEALWEAHREGIKRFRKVIEDVDSGTLEMEKLKTPKTSLLDLKVELANRITRACELCERKCGVDRREERGFCGAAAEPEISSEFLHHGEEPELVPSHTVFFCGCTFYCVYCQNYTISRNLEKGYRVPPEELAAVVDERRRQGSRNVNWVGGSPTPNLHYVLEVLKGTKENVPSVWNSNMYMSEKSVALLEGTQDVFLTDFKYGGDECAKRLSKVQNYWEVTTRNHLLARGQAELIVRHLVLPGHLECCTRKVARWVSKGLSPRTRINIMFQYHPMFEAGGYGEMGRGLKIEERRKALEIAREEGLENVIT